MFPDNFENFPDTDYRLKTSKNLLKLSSFQTLLKLFFVFFMSQPLSKAPFPKVN